MSSPFDYSNNICQSNETIWVEGISEKEYVPWMVNKALSYHYDTVMFAQEMNRRSHLDGKLQYDFLRTTINPKKKRISKWYKPENDDEVAAISAHYKISVRRAQQYLSLLNRDEITQIMSRLEKGGRSGR